jgi:hypothetical protein
MTRRESYVNFRKVYEAASAWEAPTRTSTSTIEEEEEPEEVEEERRRVVGGVRVVEDVDGGDAGVKELADAVGKFELNEVKLKKVQKVEKKEVGEQQKGVEREVRQALEPGSPISDLLRCVSATLFLCYCYSRESSWLTGMCVWVFFCFV